MKMIHAARQMNYFRNACGAWKTWQAWAACSLTFIGVNIAATGESKSFRSPLCPKDDSSCCLSCTSACVTSPDVMRMSCDSLAGNWKTNDKADQIMIKAWNYSTVMCWTSIYWLKEIWEWVNWPDLPWRLYNDLSSYLSESHNAGLLDISQYMTKICSSDRLLWKWWVIDDQSIFCSNILLFTASEIKMSATL